MVSEKLLFFSCPVSFKASIPWFLPSLLSKVHAEQAALRTSRSYK